MTQKPVKIVMTIEVFAHEMVSWDGVEGLSVAIESGSVVAFIRDETPSEISRRAYALALKEAGDENMLLVVGWQYALEEGDEVHADNGQNEDTWPSVIIDSIEYHEHDNPAQDMVIITTIEGEKVQCLVSEIRD